MSSKLKGWTLTEGRLADDNEFSDPTPADVVAALEAIHPDLENPYIILVAPSADDLDENYCQAVAVDDGYHCEIRLYVKTNDDFCHYFLTRPDEDGTCGVPDKLRPDFVSGYGPDLTAVTAAFTAFIADPRALPVIEGYQWIDNTEEIDGM